MKFALTLCVLIAAGCASPVPPPSPTPRLSQTEPPATATAPTVTLSPELSLAPEPTTRWKVDVVNADVPLTLSITTDRAGYPWRIPAGARMVLLDLPTTPYGGTIELVGPGPDCQLFDSAALLRTSFTITIRRTSRAPAAFALDLTSGATLAGQSDTDYEGGCSG
jgi:hypothetical protein